MAFARHNIEKHRLIELVRMNPILWDCRLPHYKRSDKKKAIKWNELGRVFSVNGERVQRTFTSLREIFRRELNHEKLLGTRFKSKWEYYEAMAFLKEVIRERKSRERAKSESMQQQQPNSSSNGIDEYQYFAPNDPNNPNNQPQQQQQMQEQQQKCEQQQQQQLLLPPDVILNVNATQLQQQLQKLTNNVLQSHLQQNASPEHAQQQLATIQPDLLSSSNSGSSSPSIYIKDEPDSQDETISVSTTNNERQYGSSKTATTSTTTTINCEQVSTTATLAHRENMTSSNNNNNINKNNNNKNIANNNIANNSKLSSSHQHVVAKQRRSSYAVATVNSNDADCLDDDFDNDVDDADADLDDDLDDADDIDDIVAPVTAGDGRLSAATIAATLRRRRETPREILYNKFGDFLAARLNTLNETVANELMNKILMLIAEK